jgi:recombination DNA repair RAD52 pathway protein
MTIDVNSGLSLLGIINVGEHESMYTSLTSGIDQITKKNLDQLDDFLAQLGQTSDPTEKTNLIDQITSLIDDQTTAIENTVQNDLNAQQTAIDAQSVADTIGSATEANPDSNLFKLVATSNMKQLTDSLTEDS